MKRVLYGFLIALCMAGLAYAAVLLSQEQVQTCTDTDGGVNTNVTGTAFGIRLGGGNYSHTDYCKGGSRLIEFACSTNGNVTYLQTWEQNCTCVNGRCQ